MSGENPYIKKPEASHLQKKYKIYFVTAGKTVEIDPNHIPTSNTGQPASILDIALASGIEIDHACGGVCACSTCHVIVKEGLESCSASTDDEEDQLEKAPGLTPQSRLGCQCIPNGSKDIVVEIPSWNRNLVRE